MPVHDWTRVDAGLFHDFHQAWTVELRNALNEGCLPSDYFALVEQSIRGPVPDVLTLHLTPDADESGAGGSVLAVASAPPRARVVQRMETDLYAGKANRVTVRHRHGEVVAMIEIVSPGNKATAGQLRTFVEKAALVLRQGVHLLVVDLFPPGKRDPQGIHKAIWDEFEDDEFRVPADKPLTLAAYDCGPPQTAYVEPVAVADVLPEMPLFLATGTYVLAPLETSYQEAWRGFPAAMKKLLA